uniref:Uncharacterized protein n=1 Tax=Rhizophora mucronata TaxID=61149 RepID=A0A2P2MGM8_RHIMU
MKKFNALGFFFLRVKVIALSKFGQGI